MGGIILSFYLALQPNFDNDKKQCVVVTLETAMPNSITANADALHSLPADNQASMQATDLSFAKLIGSNLDAAYFTEFEQALC